MKDSLRIYLILFAFGLGVYFVAIDSLAGLAVSIGMISLAFLGYKETSPAQIPATAQFSIQNLLAWYRVNKTSLLGGFGLLMSALAAWMNHANEFNPLILLFWLVAILSLGVAAWQHDQRKPVWPSLRERIRSLIHQRGLLIEVTALVLATGLAFLLRAYDLEHFPPTFHGDEGEMGMVARGLLSGANPVPGFVTAWLDHPSLFFYLQAASLEIFGDSISGLRMLSAIFGAACVPVIYGIGKIGWNRLVGGVAAWLLLISHLHNHFSRLGLNNIQTVFFMLLTVYLLVWLWKNSTPLDDEDTAKPTLSLESRLRDQLKSTRMDFPCVLLGLVIGLSQYFYFGSKLILVCVIPLMLILWARKTLNLRQIIVAALAALAIFAPLGGYYLDHPQTLSGRSQGVSIFKPQNLNNIPGLDPADTLVEIVGKQVSRNLLFFVGNGDASAFYLQSLPGFDPLTSVLFWLGLGVAITRIKRFPELCLVIWFGLGLFFAGFLTNDAPNAPRLIVMVPSIFLLGGILVERASTLFSRTFTQGWAALGAPLLVIGMVYTGWFNLKTYFVDYARLAPNMAAITIATEFREYRDEYDLYLAGAPVLYAAHGTLRFVVGDGLVRDLDEIDELPDPYQNGRGVMVIAVIPRDADLREIINRYPSGIFSSGADRSGREMFVAYRIPASGSAQ